MTCPTCAAEDSELNGYCTICSSRLPVIDYSTSNTVDQETCGDETIEV